MNTNNPIMLNTGAVRAFDPATKLDFTAAQRSRLEQMLIAATMVRDPNGLIILNDMDTWLAAQIVRSMFDETGAARTVAETCDLEPWQAV